MPRTSYNTVSTLWAFALGSREEVSREVNSANNAARLSPSDPAHMRLKPLGLVDTRTLDEMT